MNQSPNHIKLSRYSNSLIEHIKKLKKKDLPNEASKISVSQTATIFALLYERIRNAVEYRDANLIRRAAIERILKRRLAMNASADGEAENIIRELLWARYFPNESLDDSDVKQVQHIIHTYLHIKAKISIGQTNSTKAYLQTFLTDLMTSEIEEALSPYEAQRESMFRSFAYQVLRQKVTVEGLDEKERNGIFYVALERAFSKSDMPYLRYHLFLLAHEALSTLKGHQIDDAIAHLPETFERIDKLINNPRIDRIRRYVKSQIPPFYILFDIIKEHPEEAAAILGDRPNLWKHTERLCRLKYAQTQKRLRSLGIKAISYIFLTKMIFALILEYPVSLALFHHVNYIAIGANAIIPPLIMLLVILATHPPRAQNTVRIYDRIIDIIDADSTYETNIGLNTKPILQKRPALVFAFSIFYILTFIVTFGLLYEVLAFAQFNLISQAVFVLFVSMVTFFAYRIRQTAKEYQLKEKEHFTRPLFDFFFMPVLSLGKFLSQSVSRFNFFTVIFDFIFEAPFKLLIEVVEEWVKFVRQKRDEIV